MKKLVSYLKYIILFLPLTVLALEPEPSAPITDICGVYDLILRTVKYLIVFAIVIGALWIIISGFKLVTGGDEEKKKAKSNIWMAIVGIVIVLLAWSIVAYVIPGFLHIDTTKCEFISHELEV